MIYAWASLLVLLNAGWWIAGVFGLPGNWLMILGTAILAWVYRAPADGSESGMFSAHVLVAIVILAFVGEILEFLAGSVGAARAGATRQGSAGALVGGIAGAILGTFLIPIPIVGSLMGSAAGAGLGAVGLELSSGRAMQGSLKAGLGAGAGRILGTVLKLVVGALIWLTVAVAAFWP
ncbi:MAG TPA: DUF456 domain-containing protein [Phycisphaerae bacterium]|nr:DUF456 domain-containing protein [Phycisphaerae bacterium]